MICVPILNEELHCFLASELFRNDRLSVADPCQNVQNSLDFLRTYLNVNRIWTGRPVDGLILRSTKQVLKLDSRMLWQVLRTYFLAKSWISYILH